MLGNSLRVASRKPACLPAGQGRGVTGVHREGGVSCLRCLFSIDPPFVPSLPYQNTHTPRFPRCIGRGQERIQSIAESSENTIMGSSFPLKGTPMLANKSLNQSSL